MLCVVYVLRRHGEKLPVDVVRARPNPGWLYFGPDPRVFFPRTAARVFRDHQSEVDVIEPMVHATVKAIKGGGLLIHGQHEITRHEQQPQTWWCLPGLLDDMTVPQAFLTTGPETQKAPPAEAGGAGGAGEK